MSNAMTGLATGNREGKKQKREQEIYTPWELLEVPVATWPDGIQLDPCSGPASLVPAANAFRGVRIDTGSRTRDTELEDGSVLPGEPIYRWGGSGLIARWMQNTYVNPPFEDLEEWLLKSTIEHAKGITEQILLFPVRPNRQWWADYMRTVPTSVAWLRPFCFVGFEQSFPAPCVLVHTGTHVDPSMRGLEADPDFGLGSTLRFRSAVSELSTFVGGPLV